MRKKFLEISLWFWLSPPGIDFILGLIFAKRTCLSSHFIRTARRVAFASHPLVSTNSWASS
jgi:hypothetical protein